MKGGDGLNESEPGLFGGGGFVADTARDDEELSGIQRDRATVSFGTTDTSKWLKCWENFPGTPMNTKTRCFSFWAALTSNLVFEGMACRTSRGNLR